MARLLPDHRAPIRSLRRRLQATGGWAELAPGAALLASERHGALPMPSEASLVHYEQLLEDEAAATDIAPELLKALCWYASGWRQREPSGRVLSTPAAQGTSWGCMQLNDVWHPDAFPAAMTDAQASIRYAAKLLAWLIEQTGDDQHRAVVAFFGHDRRAEQSARRVDRYAKTRPWAERTKRDRPPAHSDAEISAEGLLVR